MSLFKKLFGSPTEGAAAAVVKTADGVADIVERWKPSEAARHQMQLELQQVVDKSLADARKYDPRSEGGGIVGGMINVFVDGLSRLIRPGLTIILIGGCFGWWPLPPPGSVDPVYMEWTYTVVAFWFGMRTVFKDVPALLQAVRGGGR